MEIILWKELLCSGSYMVKMIVSARNNACLLSNYKRPERPLNKVKVDDDSIRSLDEKKPFVTSGQEHF